MEGALRWLHCFTATVWRQDWCGGDEFSLLLCTPSSHLLTSSPILPLTPIPHPNPLSFSSLHPSPVPHLTSIHLPAPPLTPREKLLIFCPTVHRSKQRWSQFCSPMKAINVLNWTLLTQTARKGMKKSEYIINCGLGREWVCWLVRGETEETVGNLLILWTLGQFKEVWSCSANFNPWVGWFL